MGRILYLIATLVTLHLINGKTVDNNNIRTLGNNRPRSVQNEHLNEANNNNITGRHFFGFRPFAPFRRPNVVVPSVNAQKLTLGVFQPIAPLHVVKPQLPLPPQRPFTPQFQSFSPLIAPPCKCVPFYLCKIQDVVGRADGEGLIDQRNFANKQVRATVKGNSTDVNKRSFLSASRPITSTTECRDNFVCCRENGPLSSSIGHRPPSIAGIHPVIVQPSKQFLSAPGPKPFPQLQPFPPATVHLAPTLPKQPSCGVRNLNGIIGRVKNHNFIEGDTQFGEFPWHVAILKNDETGRVYICAAALISDRYILTAAHNIKGYNPGDMRIRLGDWDVSAAAETLPFVERFVEQIFIHPFFYAGNLQNDIALLRLDRPVDIISNPHIAPVCMPPRFEHFTGQRCLVTGWGKDAWGLQGSYSHVLKKVDLPILSNFDCQEKLRFTRLGRNFQLHPGFVCAGSEPGKDSCKGDGGGPLVCEYDGRYVLSGIVSWGIGCGLPGVPGVYVRVSEYLDWIDSIIFTN
ncbi:AAEL001675-PA [Chamberlinius hualienensis]